MHPCAYTNPIWVDVDGAGFTPNGENLGWGLPVEEVRRMLQGRTGRFRDVGNNILGRDTPYTPRGRRLGVAVWLPWRVNALFIRLKQR